MKIRQMGAEFHAGGRTNRHDEAESLFAILRSRQKMSRKVLERKPECGIVEDRGWGRMKTKKIYILQVSWLCQCCTRTVRLTAVVDVTEGLRKVEFSIHVVNCMYIYKGVPVKSTVQHGWIWSAATWPPHRLCYLPAIILPLPSSYGAFVLGREIFDTLFKCSVLLPFYKLGARSHVIGNCVSRGMSASVSETSLIEC